MPAVVEAATRAELEAARASTLGDDAAVEEEAAAAAADKPAAFPAGATDADALVRRTTATTDRLPAIRARLDEAVHRLQTNLAVSALG